MKKRQDNIPALRYLNQQLTNPKFKTAGEVAGWMGALQAQDYSMSKWALGIRLRNSTEASINKEIDSGKIIRTHLLRPTWHLVSSNDIYWILELTAPRIKAALKNRDKQLELSDSIYLKCNRIFEKSLRDYNHQTRTELIAELKRSKINVGENRASHIFMRAELDGLICSGKQKQGKPTYAILEEWVPGHTKTLREEGLRDLAWRYFSSHGPASVSDFTWWSGLSQRDAKLALDLNTGYLVPQVIQDQTYWMAENYSDSKGDLKEICFLPAYDEFLISYRDRTACLSLTDNKNAISNNGIFYPVVLQNGQVIGVWKRIIKNNKVIISKNLFKTVTPVQDKVLLESLAMYSGFTGRKIELI
jgi:hypothetical protein